jgi:hypothetical protein
MLKRLFALIAIVLGFFFLAATPTQAVCPVCTIAIGGGVLLSQYLGVDDLIIGVWVGGLILSLSLWGASYLKKTYLKGQQWLISLAFWVFTALSFKQTGFFGHPSCKIWGYDKLLVGMVFGTLAFLLGFGLDFSLRKINRSAPGKAFFPYQKVAMPLVCLLLATLVSLRLCQII